MLKNKIAKTIKYMKSNNIHISRFSIINIFALLYPNTYIKYRKQLDEKYCAAPKLLRGRYGTSSTKEKQKRERIVLEFLYQRQLLIYGKPICNHCNQSKNYHWLKQKSLVQFRRSVTNINIGWPKYCCDSCSKSSKEACSKRKRTCLKRYGVENVSYDEKVIVKIQETQRERFDGLLAVQHNTIKEKTKITIAKDSNFYKKRNEKSITTNLKNLGVEWPTQSAKIRSKVRKTVRRRYGVDNVRQSKDIIDKIAKKRYKRYDYKYKGIVYKNLQGYEKYAIKWLVDAGATIISTGYDVKSFCYKLDGKQKWYFPDLLIEHNNKKYIVEVKCAWSAGMLNSVESVYSNSFKQLKAKSKAVLAVNRFLLIMFDKKGKMIYKTTKLPNYNRIKQHLQMN